MKYFISLLFLTTLSGCVSINSLPQSASEANFDRSVEGKTGWAEWQDTMHVKDIDRRTAYDAAKAGLSHAGFTIKRQSFEDGFALGQHGMTPYDWNVVAGVYIKETSEGHLIKVDVKASKDIGFQGDMTFKSWTEEILKGVRRYIFDESFINKTNRDIFN